MTNPITKQELIDAAADALTLEKVLNDPANEPNPGQADGTVTARLGQTYNNVSKSIETLAASGDTITAAAAASAAAAAASATAAQSAANTIPTPGAGDAGKTLEVNSAENGFSVRPRKARVVLAYSQSNFQLVHTGATLISHPSNFKVWNGGIQGTVGSAFTTPSDTTVRIPEVVFSELAQKYPDEEIYLVTCATGGVGVRSVVGMRYQWNTSTSGDPGSGKIRFNNATPGSATEVGYSETDHEEYVRFVGVSDLGVGTDKARIAVVGSESTDYVEFTCNTQETDAGAYRTQVITVTDSANWPPANGTDVVVYPADDQLRNVITSNLEAAFTALGLTGDDRVLDEVFLWPTESDTNYADSYEEVDSDRLRAFLSTWTSTYTMYYMTRPWPHTQNATAVIGLWHNAITRYVSRNAGNTVLVGLEGSDPSEWDSAVDYLHVGNATLTNGNAVVRIGRLIARSLEKGGSSQSDVEARSEVFEYTIVSNLDSVIPLKGQWTRVDNVVTMTGRFQVDPTASGTATSFRIKPPVPSNFAFGDEAGGMAVTQFSSGHATILADTVNDEIIVSFTSVSTSTYTFGYTLMYEVK